MCKCTGTHLYSNIHTYMHIRNTSPWKKLKEYTSRWEIQFLVYSENGHSVSSAPFVEDIFFVKNQVTAVSHCLWVRKLGCLSQTIHSSITLTRLGSSSSHFTPSSGILVRKLMSGRVAGLPGPTSTNSRSLTVKCSRIRWSKLIVGILKLTMDGMFNLEISTCYKSVIYLFFL